MVLSLILHAGLAFQLGSRIHAEGAFDHQSPPISLDIISHGN